VIANGLVDAVAFGRSFIANPDRSSFLPRRYSRGAALSPVLRPLLLWLMAPWCWSHRTSCPPSWRVAA
jgi:hypothetical protein